VGGIFYLVHVCQSFSHRSSTEKFSREIRPHRRLRENICRIDITHPCREIRPCSRLREITLSLFWGFRANFVSKALGNEPKHAGVGGRVRVLTLGLTDDVREEEVDGLGGGAGQVHRFVAGVGLAFESFGVDFHDALLADFDAVGAGRAGSDDNTLLVPIAAGAAFVGSSGTPFVVALGAD
jgi:hypothetical protein